MKIKEVERNKNIDIIRFIAAFFVVCLHTSAYNSIADNIVSPIARFAVPIFFMFSGYFYAKGDVVKKKKQINKILIILFLSILIYFIEYLFYFFLGSSQEICYFEFYKIINLLIFNEPSISPHLWFIVALLYVMIIEYKIELHKKRLAPYLIAVLLFMLYFLCDLSSFINIEIDEKLYRNFLFEGLPFFVLGEMFNFKRYIEYPNKISSATKALGVVLCLILVLVENRFLYFRKDIYLGTIVFTILIFSIVINMTNFSFKYKFISKSYNVLALMGCKYSLGIYIAHPLIKHAFDYFQLSVLFQSKIYLYTLVIFIATLLLVILYYFVKNVILKCL